MCMDVYVQVCVCVWFHNLTRDYMSSTELMSESTGSALVLTGGRPEREKKRHDGPAEGRRGEEVDRTDIISYLYV